jgi:MoaD family protein
MPNKIKIILHAIYREIAGGKEIKEELTEICTVKNILNRLAENYGRDFKKIINPKTQQISNNVLVMLNGKSLRSTDTRLQNNDIIMITIATANLQWLKVEG